MLVFLRVHPPPPPPPPVELRCASPQVAAGWPRAPSARLPRGISCASTGSPGVGHVRRRDDRAAARTAEEVGRGRRKVPELHALGLRALWRRPAVGIVADLATQSVPRSWGRFRAHHGAVLAEHVKRREPPSMSPRWRFTKWSLSIPWSRRARARHPACGLIEDERGALRPSRRYLRDRRRRRKKWLTTSPAGESTTCGCFPAAWTTISARGASRPRTRAPDPRAQLPARPVDVGADLRVATAFMPAVVERHDGDPAGGHLGHPASPASSSRWFSIADGHERAVGGDGGRVGADREVGSSATAAPVARSMWRRWPDGSV